MSFPPIDPAVVRPDVAAVALLEMTRTVDQDGGDEVGIFTATTRPTAAQVEELIDLASTAVLGRLPGAVDPALYPAITDLIATRSAILVEFSFYREQFETGPAASLLKVLTDDAAVLAARAHGGPSFR